MRAHPFFDEDARRRIEAAVAAAESRSTGEIVPVVVDRSDAYPEAQDRGGVLFAMIATVVCLVLPLELPLWGLAAIQGGAFVVGYLAALWDPLERMLVGRKSLDAMVRWRAEVAFREEGLARTAQGTGVLIFASLFEHEVVILGDKPVHEKVGEAGWREAVDALVRRIRDGRPADGFVEAIELVGGHLERHFPKGPGPASNELPDRLTIR